MLTEATAQGHAGACDMLHSLLAEMAFEGDYGSDAGDFSYADGEIVAYRDFLRTSPLDIKMLIRLGEALVRKGDPGGALGVYRSATALASGEPMVLLMCEQARCMHQMGQTENAIAYMRRVIEDHSDNAHAHWRLGSILCQKKKLSHEELDLAEHCLSFGSDVDTTQLQSRHGAIKAVRLWRRMKEVSDAAASV